MKLMEIVKNIFSDDEIKKISKKWLNSEVDLVEIEDQDEYIEDCDIKSNTFKTAGPERLKDWEWGWAGNGVTNESRDFPNIPYYFKNNKFIRIGPKVYEDHSSYTEIRLLRMLQDIALSKIELQRVNALIEYGAGTGHNLTYLSEKIDKNLYGSDWAIPAVTNLVEKKIVKNGRAFRVDYFDKTSFQAPDEKYVAFTNASLEQTGENYEEFMNFLINDERCQYGIHIEPISDLIAPSHKLNIQSIRYAKRRKYLEGFYSFMKMQPVQILFAKDFEVGSQFISGYQVIVWGRNAA